MNTVDLLPLLRSHNIRLWVENDQLRYSAPKGGITDDLLAEIRKNKVELLNLVKNSERFRQAVPLSPVKRTGNLRLSFAQERLWFLYHLFPESPAYNISILLRLAGIMDIPALQKSLQALVDRHESLRTCFPTIDGQPVQVIRDDCPVPLVEHNLKDLPEAERETAADKLTQEEILQPFDLTHGPVIRATLLRIADQDHILLVTLHHIVTDGWSRGIIQSDLAALYNSQVFQQTPALPALPIQYVDFAHWQRQWLTGEVLEAQLGYWRKQLADVPRLELPTDRLRPPVQTYSGDGCHFRLTKTLTEGLHALSRREEVTLATTLLAGFQVLLGRYTGQTDIAVGSPIANRTHADIENLVGFFVNTLVMRTDLSGDPTFREVLARVHEVALGAYEHQDLPFEQLVDDLKPERDFSRNPLFQVMFAVQNAPRGDYPFHGLTGQPIKRNITTTRMDLECYALEEREEFHFTLIYNTNVFDRETIERAAGHYQRVLAEVVRHPAQRLSHISLLEEPERQQLLVEWNATKREYPKASCIHQCFEAQVARTPTAAAVVFGAEQLTYAQLNVRANQLADVLQQRGVGPDTLVGLCVERSLDMLVGLLGILKAGAAYVPLDPTYPSDRLHFMIDDAQMPVIVTHRRLPELLHLDQRAGPFSSSFKPTFVDLDAVDWQEEELVSANPISAVTPQDLMYVIYTSGSTGKPKGVMIAHRTVGNFLHAMQEELALRQQDTFLALTSISFDIAVLELFGPLLVGGGVHLVSRDTAMDGRALVEALTQSKASLMQATPVTWQLLVDAEWPGSPGLRALCGGEALAGSLGQALLEKGVTLWNMYGPTETTVWSALHRVSPDDHKVPIGRPIANTQLYVLDAEQHLVPVGVPGELYIGGEGLSRGYWRREELTRERFIPHPFDQDPHARVYRTGDRVRYRADGTLEFLGRMDHQIKLRGFRIELGEIETTLAQHPGVQESVVLVREDVPGEKRLVAYIIPSESSTPSARELKEFLQEKLPAYMVPSAWVELDTFPLTPNGKVDRRALPKPDSSLAQLAGDFVAPRSPIEEGLGQIWKDVLHLEQVGVYDNFFEVGGHSLLATQIISRVRDIFQVEVPLRRLFEGPTIDSLTKVIENTRRAGQTLTAHPLVPCSRAGTLPLSFAQQRLWFLHQLEPESHAYNMSLVRRLQGPLDVAALRESLQALVDRHESLRTCFPVVNGHPSQVIANSMVLPWDQQDLREVPEGDREVAAQELIRLSAMQPFDLATGPVIRTRLLQLADAEYVLLLTLHHIISDGWSLGVVSREVAALYDTFVNHQPSPLPPLTIHYADFAQWQRQWFTGEVLEQQLTYWREHLADLSTLALPTDRLRPPVQTHSGAGYRFRVSKSLTQGLQALSRQAEVTVATTLLAAFQVLLARYTGQTDIAVGSPIANRTRSELEHLVGFFVNTLVLRTNLSGDPTFRAVLARVHDVALEAYDHQDLPFEQLVEELQPERDPSRNPLFQVLFAFQNVPREAAGFQGLTMRPMGKEITTTRMDLECFVGEEQEGLQVTVVFNTDLFDKETIERFGTHFHAVLTEVVRDPAQRLSQLSLLDEAERQQLLVAWNATQRDYPKASGIHQCFEAQVARTPHAVAVVFEEEQLTYGELNTRANQLAHYLQKQGIGPESRVGLCVERSVDMVVGLLGILKAGGAYVPLDPAYPADRLRFMLEDTQARVVVTHSHLHPRLPQTSASVLCLDRDGGAIAQEPTSNPSRSVTAENVAYVIFTSGSTGTPKGVALCHRTLTNLIAWQAKARRTPAGGTTLQFASLSFDVSCQEIFSTWSAGGRLLVIPEATRKDCYQLLDVLDREGVERVFLPYMALQQLATVAQDHGRRPATVREVITAGEQLKISETIVQLLSHQPEAVLVNQYGPSESHVVTSYALAESPEDWPALPPIGQPIDNTEIYVVDAHLEPVPIGARGELYIGGTGHARGYGNRPALTAERFVPHPFSHQPGARLYRSGDHARYRADGNIEFLGRIDHQVKLRGFRIELGEIEGVLAQHPEVQESVALVREEMPGDQRLVAYVVAVEATLSPSDLRQFLKQTLPEYMVPASFVMLDALPLTPTGKVDRRALPVPEGSRGNLETGFVPPQTPTEQRVAAIWQEVLGVEQVGIHDNFFELGGHSLLATQVVSRVREQLQVELPLRELFQAPTVAGLVIRVESLAEKEFGQQLPPLTPCSRADTLPLSFAQQRLWFLDQFEPDSTAYLLTQALRLTGTLNHLALEQSLNALVARHESLRTTFAMAEGEPVQVIAPSLMLPLPVVDLQDLAAEAQEPAIRQRVQKEASTPFDLAVGPLIRTTLLKIGPEEQVFLLTLHHIITDGWSMGILFRELAALYQAACEGQPAELPPLAVQYADYSAWQRQWLQGEQLDRQLAYWREQLTRVPTLTLPTDFPRPAIQDYRGERITLQVPPAITEKLKAVSRQAGATLFMTMLAAFQLVLQRWSGQDEVCVGIPSAGRTRQEIEPVIGFFINTLVVRTDISGQPTFIELLEQVRKKCLGAYAHQDVPFEKLVEELHPARQLNRNPFFDVLFNFVGDMNTTFELPEVTIKKLSHGGLESKFALTLYVAERENGIYCSLVFQTALFRAERMQALVAQYHQVLEQAAAAAEQSIQSFSLVTNENRAWLPDPQARLEAPPQDSVLACIRQWARRTPDQVAVRHGSETLRYGELLSRSQACAQALRRQGLVQDDVVAIRGPRSSGLIVAVVGVWQAGGVVLLLDPLLPGPRQSVMREASGAQFLVEIGSGKEYESGPDEPLVPCLFVDPSTGVVDSSGCGGDEGESSLPSVPAEGPAYVFFTSGTTGVPKGVLGSHQALAHFLAWERETLAIEPEDRVAQFTGLSFDVVLRDLFLPLTSGATVCVPPEEVGDQEQLAWAAAEQITVMHLVPSVASFWLAATTEAITLPALRWVVFAGEPLTAQLLKRWEAACPGQAEFVNLYGPTETTLAKCWYLIPPDREEGVQPIGRPLPETQLLVLGKDHRLCGLGEVGELVLRTPFCSLGYLNAEEETQSGFVPNPYREDPTDVLYHTGDLGRYRLDGTVEILGRRDDQVKIRGVRVEPQEVMAVLSTCPEVQMCTVLASRDTHDEIALTAFVVPQPDSSLSGSAMRAYLSARIPSALVPSQYVRLAQFPLTPNGKIDRQALRSLTPTEITNETYVAPRTDLEELIVEVWQEVLKVERIGIHDNFFELGGHSLLATRVIARLRNVLDLDIPLRTLFEQPTVEQLAQVLDTLLTAIFADRTQEEAD